MDTRHLAESIIRNSESDLANLTSTQRLILQAKHIYGLSNKDIATVLGKTESTIRSYIAGRNNLDRGNAGLLMYAMTGTLPKYFRRIAE